MGYLTAGQLAEKVQRRITQLNATDALQAINDAYEWVWMRGSFTFQLTGSQSVTPTTISSAVPPGPPFDLGQISLPTDCDLGKAIFLANSPQGTPIEKRPIQDFSMSFALNLPANQGFHVYTISGRNLLLRPSQTAQNVGIRYHTLFIPLLAGQTPLTPSDFDDVLVRLAEANERRIYDVGDSWPQLRKDAEEDTMKLLDNYRSVTQEAMPGAEAVVAVQEKTRVGRG